MGRSINVDNLDDTSTLSNNLGSKDSTSAAVTHSKTMVNSASDASRTNSASIDTCSNTEQNYGYGAQASLSYLNNISTALTTLTTNLKTTEDAAVHINELNDYVKELNTKYLAKEELEAEKETKEELLSVTNPKKTITNEDGTKSTVDNQEYLNILSEITRLDGEIALIDADIEDLITKIQDKYFLIQSKYGDLIQFDFSSITYDGNKLSTGIFFDSDDDIKEYMLENNLEYFEYNNIIYNIPSPYSPFKNKTFELEEKYLIKYDLNKLESLVEEGNLYAEEAIAFLRGKASGEIPASQRNYFYGDEQGFYRHYYYSEEKGKWIAPQINGKELKESDMAIIMDCVLDDTYRANHCDTATDYAVVSMMTVSAGIFNGKYSNCESVMAEGITGIIHSSDCIGAVNWSVYQAFCMTDNFSSKSSTEFDIPLRFALHDKYSSKINYKENDGILPVGTIVSSKEHVAMVVGHTTVDGKRCNVVAQTGNKKYGYNVNPITKPKTFDRQVSVDDLLTKWKEKHPETSEASPNNV